MMKLAQKLPYHWFLWTSLGIATLGVAFSNGPDSTFVILQSATTEQTEFFETKIRPLFQANCVSCHGKTDPDAGLSLETAEGIRTGGKSGPVIVPGDPDKSILILAVRQTGPLKMPKGKRLRLDEVANLEKWVKMGAPWPAPAPKPAASLWSLQPVKSYQPPKVKDSQWVKNPIDSFVLAKLEAAKQAPSPTSDRATLIRRVTYDLTGLPPSAAEVDAFITDKTPGAYESVVDRLLASPRYGERWARLWLDVARYSDTKGYVFEEDRVYHNAYTYRNWVIDAFNKDLSYDLFIIQQLAADRLPDVRDSDDKKPLAALGFLNIGRRFLNSQPDIIDDRIDVTMRGFQGLTVACARCHDHKFDPIPTQDYYSLYGVFASTNEVTAPISEKSIREPWEVYNQKVSANETSIRDLVTAQIKALRKALQAPEAAAKVGQDIKQILQALREEAIPTPEALAKLAKAFPAAESERLNDLQQSLAKLQKAAPKSPEFAMAMTDSSNPGDGVVFKRGNPGNPGEIAPRRFLKALCSPEKDRDHWTVGSGRLELAKAIASKENPLTARVFVNRVWQNHFGFGLVRTASDFGKQGEKPTHPELLDYLASWFMEQGWSIKKLHKLIVTSATYCQSSNLSAPMMVADPENRLLGRMNRRRMDLEQMRDSILLSAGRLDLKEVGGKSVDLWSEPYSQKRAVYGFVERQNLPGVFRTFDFASPDSTSSRRFQTTVPQQALFFMNSNFVVSAAEKLCGRAEITSAKELGQRVRKLYQLVYSRLPNKAEETIGIQYLQRSPPTTISQIWQYGYGKFAPSGGPYVSFTPLPFFGDGTYRGGQTFPDAKLGWVMLASTGGHPGHDESHAAIRRWNSPVDGAVSVGGILNNGATEGNGVRARVVSSRLGLLGEWQAHHGQATTDVTTIKVNKGDSIDFIVDSLAEESFDGFSWAPTIRMLDGSRTWSASADFAGPSSGGPSQLVLYAQALMMANEFMFID